MCIRDRTQAQTQNVESMWVKAKMRNKRQRGTSRLMLDSYLAEFMWRQRYRNDDKFKKIKKLLKNLLNLCLLSNLYSILFVAIINYEMYRCICSYKLCL